MITEALKQIKKNTMLFITAAIIDIIFLLAYGFYTAPIKNQILTHAALITSKLAVIMAEKPTGILKQAFAPEIRPYTIKLIIIILILFITTYLVYVISQGTSWWITTRIAGKKHKYHEYMKEFAKINLIWLAFYAAYKILQLIITTRQTIIQKITETTGTTNNILFGMALLIGITAFFSYPTLKTTTLLKTPLHKTLPIIAIGLGSYLIIQIITTQITNPKIALATGIILLFPTIIFTKILTIQNVHTHN